MFLHVRNQIQFALERFEAHFAAAGFRDIDIQFVGFNVNPEQFFGAESLVALGAVMLWKRGVS